MSPSISSMGSRNTSLDSRRWVDGSIDWTCFPRFDSPSVFGRILDADRGGHFLLTGSACREATRAYVEGGKGEVALIQAVSGRDALYVVQRAWRGDAFRGAAPAAARALLPGWQEYLDKVRVCDTRDKTKPCSQ